MLTRTLLHSANKARIKLRAGWPANERNAARGLGILRSPVKQRVTTRIDHKGRRMRLYCPIRRMGASLSRFHNCRWKQATKLGQADHLSSSLSFFKFFRKLGTIMAFFYWSTVAPNSRVVSALTRAAVSRFAPPNGMKVRESGN
uniref:Transcriptional regulator n=1 Tax=Macrostomum lignano TaxID=282301 RepID=A0A1I8FQZ7_9PLAT